jgi:glycosyltransferase involved in cell wall biosynthesis
MNLLFLQRLDQAGGGSRASLRTTLRALRGQRPDWRLALATGNLGPLSHQSLEWGVNHAVMTMPHFRNHLQRPAYWLACRCLAGWARTIRPDVILSNEWVTAPHALSAGRRLGIPAMSYVRDFAALERGRKYKLHRMDRLLCVCESMRRGLIGVGYDPEKVSTVYNPVLRPAFREPTPELRDRILGHADVDRWLLYLGRISPRKNQIAAVETLRCLRGKTGQSWGLLLAGDADESYASQVNKAVAAAGLKDAVLRLGIVPEPGWLFELADASVLTSKSEGLARVLIESFLCGKPGFSFPLDGLEDIYGEELPFFVPERAAPENLAMTIAAAVDNTSLCDERTERLRIMLEQRHSLECHVNSFEAALGPV